MYSFAMYYIKCVHPDQEPLKMSKHVPPLNAYTLTCLDCYYVISNLKHNCVTNLKIY